MGRQTLWRDIFATDSLYTHLLPFSSRFFVSFSLLFLLFLFFFPFRLLFPYFVVYLCVPFGVFSSSRTGIPLFGPSACRFFVFNIRVSVVTSRFCVFWFSVVLFVIFFESAIPFPFVVYLCVSSRVFFCCRTDIPSLGLVLFG